jgi:hypothetical protein
VAEESRQGRAIIRLGTPTNPTLYTARVLRGPSSWQRLALAFVATEPTLRISLLGQADTPGQTVEFDGIRFLPPGRNPVLLMATIFARFLPHLELDQASVTAAAERRNEWLFSGYIPDPGRTDNLLTRMAQECFCTVFKDLDGVYRITADDPDHLPVLHLDSQHDIVQETLEVQGLPMEQAYTDFYLWYQRVTSQVTTSQAGQYAAVLYVTPDDSISQYAELQTLCAQAADALQTRTRFDFHCDFIADPATADLLLSRLVRQLTVLRREVSLSATLPALPLSVTDHVAVRAPLLGQQPFVGELRRAAVGFTSQAPGLAMALTLRESGLLRGVWESWDTTAGDTAAMGPRGSTRVRESWEHVQRWFHHTSFAAYGAGGTWCPALAGLFSPALASEQEQLYLALGPGLSALPSARTAPPLWKFTNANVATMAWSSALTASSAGAGTALTMLTGAGTPPALTPYAALIPPAAVTPTLWQLDPANAAAGQQLATVPGGLTGSRVWSMFHDGVNLYIGLARGEVYRIASGGGATLVHTVDPGESPGRRVRSMMLVAGGGAYWIAADNVSLTSTPSALIYRSNVTVPPNWNIYAIGGTQVCNFVAWNDTLWIASGLGAGAGAGTRVDLWALAGDGVTWSIRYTISGLTDALPSSLAAYDGRLYLGLMSMTQTTSLKQIWRSDTTGDAWELDIDVAVAFPADLNTGVTALGVARRRLYAATGTPFGGPSSGVQVYCSPGPEAITGA